MFVPDPKIILLDNLIQLRTDNQPGLDLPASTGPVLVPSHHEVIERVAFLSGACGQLTPWVLEDNPSWMILCRGT